MSVNSKMTALANEIRELSGTTEKIGLDDMTTYVANANTEVNSQATKLAELKMILAGKAAGGSGSSGATIDTCTIHLICSTSSIYGYSYMAYRDGKITPVIFTNQATRTTLDVTFSDVVCDSLISVHTDIASSLLGSSVQGDAVIETTNYYSSATITVSIYVPNEAGSTSIVTIYDDN